jgi:hypothetical protein
VATDTLAPGITPTATSPGAGDAATPTPTSEVAQCTYDADFVEDVTIPDDSEIEPDTAFVKTWRMRNSGTCAWEPGAAWVFVSGDQMGGPDSVVVPAVAPGETADISVNLTAPDEPGTYTGYWQLSRPGGGDQFGTRSYVRIIVPAEEESTVTPSPTPTLTPQPGVGPSIGYFRANVDQADPGDEIQLEWQSTGGDRAILYHLLPSGQFGDAWDVDPSGTFDYEIDEDERNYTAFTLQVFDADNRMAQASVSIPLNCLNEWFFSPAPDECPRGPAIFSNAAEQHFEHGTLLWVEDQDLIYVIFDDGKVPGWTAYPDEWQEGDPEYDPDIVPPEGYYQPIRGFGLVWRTKSTVRDRLGWAVDLELAFDSAVQSTSRAKYNDTYVRALDEKIWWLKAEGTAWVKITPD